MLFTDDLRFGKLLVADARSKQKARETIKQREETEKQRTRGNQVSFNPEEIEKMVMEEMRRIYSEKAIDHAMNPRNVGHLKESDRQAKIKGSYGDTMEISIRTKDARAHTKLNEGSKKSMSEKNR